MASKLTRKLLKLFASSGGSGNFTQYGSPKTGTPVYTKDIDSIQSLSAYSNGWQDAVYGTEKAPVLEDMNALQYLQFYQMCYALQEGVPEWEVGTEYFVGSIVKKSGTFELYGSLIDNSVGNVLPSKVSNGFWKYLGDLGDYGNASNLSTGNITDSIHGNRAGGALHSNADGTNAGFMSPTDFTKLAGLVGGANKVYVATTKIAFWANEETRYGTVNLVANTAGGSAEDYVSTGAFPVGCTLINIPLLSNLMVSHFGSGAQGAIARVSSVPSGTATEGIKITTVQNGDYSINLQIYRDAPNMSCSAWANFLFIGIQ